MCLAFFNGMPGDDFLYADNGSVLITEIMYHPGHPDNEAENTGEEFIEIYNSGDQPVDLSGWQFTNGIDFVFPGITLDPHAYLVVAADLAPFSFLYPDVANVTGNWNGKLSNSGERIELEDHSGQLVDDVRYSDEGQWAVRELGPPDHNHRGWTWSDAHDGGGKSLELINLSVSNETGQNWSASSVPGGTPGRINSVSGIDPAPVFLEVNHYPVIPHSDENVAVVAGITDDHGSIQSVTLYFRRDGQPQFDAVLMKDDGLGRDVEADDGSFTGTIPAMPDRTVMEFYLEAADASGQHRSFPAPANVDGSMAQVTNLLYQVDDSYSPVSAGKDPLYRIIMKEEERAELIDVIGSGIETDRDSNAEMNATFISRDTDGLKVRHNTGARIRGKGTRKRPPVSLRINFPSDHSWNGVTAINLNTKFTHLQILGSAVFKKAGLPVADAKAVKVFINGDDPAMSETIPERMYGKFAYVEVINSDFAGSHFAGDNSGNIYRCMRYDDGIEADWRYEGTDPAAYADTYFKESNNAEYDWSDLIQLTDILNNAPEATYVDDVNRVLNVPQWMRWYAVEVMMSNNETNPSSGQGDDYYMYRGEADTRFVMLPHDLDTIFGEGREKVSANTLSIWAPRLMPAMNRFLTHPAFITQYYNQLKDVIGSVFEPVAFDALIDDVFGGWVMDEPALAGEIGRIRKFVSDRRKFILTGGYPGALSQSEIPQTEFAVDCELQQAGGKYITKSPQIDETRLHGTADVFTTQSITVADVPAAWNPVRGTWRIDSDHPVQLMPGHNAIVVSACSGTDGSGGKLHSETIDIVYEVSTFGGTLVSDTTLKAEYGPWHVTAGIVIPSRMTLTIEPGTDLIFEEGTGITVQQGGCLVAAGTGTQPVGLLRSNDSQSHWRGITYQNTLEDNRLCHVNMEYGDDGPQSIEVHGSRLFIDHMTWTPSGKTIIEVYNPSLRISHSVFPTVSENEPIHGQKLEGDACFILDNNTFNPVTGYNDIIDFSGCKRPGPILQVLNNTFSGGGDDGLDLDGCDAHVEGNVFMNFHQSGSQASTSNAIATGQFGGLNSDITVVRNIFYDNDHAVLLKEDAFMVAENNVIVNSTQAAINFGEYPYRDVAPGQGAWLDGNIFYNNAAVFENRFAQPGAPDPDISVNRSIIASAFHDLGEGNLDADPLFVNATGDFHLNPQSPAIGKGPNGLDMGRYVQAGASISGEPGSPTKQTQALLTIGGPGITHYTYCVNDTTDSWSDVAAIDSIPQIALNNLTDGQSYTLYVKGRNSANVWQSDPALAVSKTWKVQISGSDISEGGLPAAFHLYQNMPNPFNSTTHIAFDLPEDAEMELAIHNLLGKSVRTFQARLYPAGQHEVIWNGLSDDGKQVPTGIYFVRAKAKNHVFIRKMLLVQ
ncbi:CotH kinase family protein [bacterium]|nr:CotH kinase family protein [bacterium]